MFQRILAFAGLIVVSAPLLAEDPAVINIGIGDAGIRGLSSGQKDFINNEFSQVVLDFTGLKSKVSLGGSVTEAVKKLQAGDWHLGIFQGVEFAWAQARDPKLKPLMVGIYRQPELYAEIVTKKDDPAKSALGLKGKDVGVVAKEHCQLFADKVAGGKASAFFGKVLSTTNVEHALDGVLLGKVEAAVVDNAGMQIYKDVNPGRFARLKVLAKSERFPPGTIAYREGVLSDKILVRFRDGMLKANKSDNGRDAMANFQISSLEPVPPDYNDTLASILKAYPPPKE